MILVNLNLMDSGSLPIQPADRNENGDITDLLTIFKLLK